VCLKRSEWKYTCKWQANRFYIIHSQCKLSFLFYTLKLIETCLWRTTGLVNKVIGNHTELGVRSTCQRYHHFVFASVFSFTSQVHEFMAMPLDTKTRLKWKLFLERCAARILVLRSSSDRPRPLISLLSCTVADPSEAAACIPVYWFPLLCSFWCILFEFDFSVHCGYSV
jgi:hypothetical protein